MAGALTLAIESSNHSDASPGSVALGRRHGRALEPIALRTLTPEGRHDDALMPAIDALLRDAGARARSLETVCVSLGPGAYSALRIGVTTAKLIAEATGAGCVGVPSACVAAHEAFARASDEVVVVTLAAKRGVVWSGVVRRGAPGLVEEAGVRDAPALTTLALCAGATACLADSHLPEAACASVREAGVRIDPIYLTARSCLAASAHFHPVDPAALAPIYAREPEAVRIWRRDRAVRADDLAASSDEATPRQSD